MQTQHVHIYHTQDSASGLCHYRTMGLPPENLFYLYIPVGCLDSSLPLQTEATGCRWRFSRRLWSSAVSRHLVPLRTNRAAPGSPPCVEKTFLTDLIWWLVVELCLFCMYIYILKKNALRHFNIFYRTKANRRITRMRQSIHIFSFFLFHMSIKNDSGPFFSWRDISWDVFFS